MAANETAAPPIIVEPALSLEPPSPANSLVNSSPDPSSATDSYDSSRPQSQNSSNTSHSEPPSPSRGHDWAPAELRSPNATELSRLGPPSLAPPAPGTSPSNPFASENDSPISGPLPSPTNTSNGSQNTWINRQTSWLSTIPTKIHERRWLENTIGVLGVAVAIWLGVRGYKLAVWQSWNDLRQTCASYKQVSN